MAGLWPRALPVALLCAGLACMFVGAASAARGDPAAEAARLTSDLERDLKRPPARMGTSGPSARSLLTRGKSELMGGRYASALDALHAALALEQAAEAPVGLAPEIEFLLGDVYLGAAQPYSAHRQYLAVVTRAHEPAYARFAVRAATRLVDAAFATQNPDLLPPLVAVLDAVEGSDEISYARAKLAFALGRHRTARELVEGVSQGGLTYKRSLYLKGAALVKEAAGSKRGFELAIAEFERAVQAPAPEDAALSRQVSDLARLAVARLHYESGSLELAVRHFTRIDPDSPIFSEALRELAWAYVKQGDFTRAEQTLAALSVLDPGLIDGADAALLRADMLLRSGHFRDAEMAYAATYQRYEPLRRDLDHFLAHHAAPADYYARLALSQLELEHELPKALIELVREQAREDRLFAVVDEVARARLLAKEARRIGNLARATVTGPSQARLFPQLEARLEALSLQENRLARARLSLARGLDRVAGSPQKELTGVRTERRALMDEVAALATTPAEVAGREARAQLPWTALGQALKRLEVEAEHTQALCNGLRRVLADADAERIVISEEAKRRHREELLRGERDLVRFREAIEELRRQVDYGKVRQGFGDDLAAAERKVAVRFGDVLERELLLVARGSDASAKARRYASEQGRLIERMAAIERSLREKRGALSQEISAASAALAEGVVRELELLAAHEAMLDELEREHAEELGRAAKKSFVFVRDRLTKVVRHAELGMAQKSFEAREERRRRVERLKRQRARETKLIADELAEVMGDGEERP